MINYSYTLSITAMRPEQPCRFIVHSSDGWTTGGLRSTDVAAMLRAAKVHEVCIGGIIDGAVEAFPGAYELELGAAV